MQRPMTSAPRSPIPSVEQHRQIDEIEQFQRALDAIADPQWHVDARAIDTLADFFTCRCHSADQQHALGKAVLSAARSGARSAVSTGLGDEVFTFDRDDDRVRVAVGQMPLAEIPLDSAIRLAELLSGAPCAACERTHAA